MSVCVSVLVLALVAADASPEDVQQAKQAFEQAEHDYRVGEFAQALEGYKKAYDHYPRPEFLFNIAQAQRGLRNWQEAIFSFELYLRDAPDAADAEDVRALIKELEPLAAAQRVPLMEAPPPAPPPVVVAEPEPEPELESESPVYKKWWFWATVGAVVAAGATTGAVVATQSNGTPSGSLGTFDYR